MVEIFDTTERNSPDHNAFKEKIDKDKQDEQIFNQGQSTIFLRDFIDLLLAQEFGEDDKLPAFYLMVEKFGLVIYDKNNNEKLATIELLQALKKRQQAESDSSLQDWAIFDFWAPLQKESNYSLRRDDIAKAYFLAGKEHFPWLNLLTDKVTLEVEDHINIDSTWEFGFPAQLSDYQNAFLQDAWTWQEALCWLKGRIPDARRLHQLPKFYSTETDLMIRAIKSKRMTADSSSPSQWIEWAKIKKWNISPLIGQHMNSCSHVENMNSESKHKKSPGNVSETLKSGDSKDQQTTRRTKLNLIRKIPQQTATAELSGEVWKRPQLKDG